MPPPSSRMTKQPARPTRFYPGKALAEDPQSDEESDEESEADEETQPAGRAPVVPPPSYPSRTKPSNVASQPPSGPNAPAPKPEIDLEGFVTASESSDEGSEEGSSDGEESGAESSEEESSSDDEPKKPMLAPRFIPKAKREKLLAAGIAASTQDEGAEAEQRRKEKADALLQAQLERDAAARAAGKKYWDDEDIAPEDEIDDTDDRDPEAEKAAWKLRELKRVRRDRQALIEKEQEREEIERRRNMSAEEREKEDREYLERQAEERSGKGKMAYMQKYFHKGAFFQGDTQDEEVQRVLNRDLAGARFEDEADDKSMLPEYMRIRDMTRLGKKGRTRYKDLKTEDTGVWGQTESRRREDHDVDDRFRSDESRTHEREVTGANSAPIGERRRRATEDEQVVFEQDRKRARHD